MVKNLPANAGDTSSILPWRRKWQPTPVFLPGESRRQRRLVAYSPWGRKESDTVRHTGRHRGERWTRTAAQSINPGASCLPSNFTQWHTFWLYDLVVQPLSRVRLWYPMDYSTSGFPVLHYLPELAQTHVHWDGDAIQTPHPLLSPSPLALNFFPVSGSFPMSLLFASGGQTVVSFFISVGNPLQYSCLGNPMDRGAWWATVHRVTKSQTGLSN